MAHCWRRHGLRRHGSLAGQEKEGQKLKFSLWRAVRADCVVGGCACPYTSGLHVYELYKLVANLFIAGDLNGR